LTENAIGDLNALDARWRATVHDAIRVHLTHEPTRESKSRIKRLREIKHPQFRLRVGEVRVFYDVTERHVVISAIMSKEKTRKMIKVPLSKVKDNFSEIIKKASKEKVVVTIHGRPAAVIIGFEDEEDWLEYRLLNDEKFLARVSQSRQQYKEGKYKTLQELS